MYSKNMQYDLVQLFALMSGEGAEIPQLRSVNMGNGSQGNLFADSENEEQFFSVEESDLAIIAALHSDARINFSDLPTNVRHFFELSVDAFGTIVHSWMSELPVTAEIVRFGRKVFASAGRQDANRIAADRGDPDVQAVQQAAYKTWHEYHRLMGLLRFSPDEDGIYIARCEPDHFVLPALGPHFRERFGQTPWAIIDEKRRLCLRCMSAQALEFFCTNGNATALANPAGGEWENLWRHYHKTINNESRNNPDLQRKFMPERYWKYLTEM